mmetsp:Transcript_37694/g.94783  ORF Transcript_37694/g.94783 Transcript_37694/m.94783 type:complete len:234 (-) Transcript_37694:622-1323(-)
MVSRRTAGSTLCTHVAFHSNTFTYTMWMVRSPSTSDPALLLLLSCTTTRKLMASSGSMSCDTLWISSWRSDRVTARWRVLDRTSPVGVTHSTTTSSSPDGSAMSSKRTSTVASPSVPVTALTWLLPRSSSFSMSTRGRQWSCRTATSLDRSPAPQLGRWTTHDTLTAAPSKGEPVYVLVDMFRRRLRVPSDPTTRLRALGALTSSTSAGMCGSATTTNADAYPGGSVVLNCRP